MRIQILFVLFLVNLAQNTNGRKKLKLKKQQRKEVHFKSWSKSENRSWTKITRNGRTRLMKNATKRSTNNSKASEDTRKWDVVWEEARRAVEAASEEHLVISSHCFRTEQGLYNIYLVSSCHYDLFSAKRTRTSWKRRRRE